MVLVFGTSSQYLCMYTFNFNPFCSFQDMARVGNMYGGKWLRGHISVNMQGSVMVLVHCPSTHCYLSINQFHLNDNSGV